MYNFHVINRLAPFFKRVFTIIFLLQFVLLAGCKTDLVMLPDPDAGREIDVVAAVPAGIEAKALRAAVDVYRLETGLVVQVAEYAIDTYGPVLESILLSGRSDFDLIYLPASQLPRWAGYKALQPISDSINRSAASTTVNGKPPRSLHLWTTNLTISDHLYGFPTQPAVEGIWYRSDLLAQAGLQPPASWEDFRALAQTLHKPPDRYGLALAGGGLLAGGEFAAVLAGFGGQVFAPTGSPSEVVIRLNQSEARSALAYYQSLWEEPAPVTPEARTASRAEARDALRSGRAAMAILPLTEAPALLDCTDKPATCLEMDGQPARSSLAFAPLPGMPTGTAVGELGAWAVPLHAARGGAAMQFAAWLVGEAGALVWAQQGGIPAWQGPWDDPRLSGSVSYLSVLEGIDAYHLPVLPVRNNSQVAEVLQAGVSAVTDGQADPAQVIEEMEAQLRRVLHQAGYSAE